MPTLVVRADADSTLGAGHVMRCSNVLAAWCAQGHGRGVLWGTVEQQFAKRRRDELGIPQVSSCPADDGALLLVDSYDASVRAAAVTLAAGRPCVLVDDVGGAVPPGYAAVWNPNAYGTDALYRGFAGA